MAKCHQCGMEAGDTAKFCRHCGVRVQSTAEEAATWRLPSSGASGSGASQPTSPVKGGPTGEPLGPTGPAYMPPAAYYPPAPLVPPAPAAQDARSSISLGDWLSGGWRIYKENWLLMSLAAMFGAFLSVCTFGILAGPTLMGLFGMAFKTMRGERPEMGDLFKWEGKFFQALLAAIFYGAVYFGLSAIGGKSGLLSFLQFVIDPLVTIACGLTLPLILERRIDVAAAINEVVRLILKRQPVMWWVVGLVFSTIIFAGLCGGGIGIFVTAPWIICSTAVAYQYIFGIDNPNRTLP